MTAKASRGLRYLFSIIEVALYPGIVIAAAVGPRNLLGKIVYSSACAIIGLWTLLHPARRRIANTKEMSRGSMR
jgi:hypothetical protein